MKFNRYILYDREFMDAIAARTNSWSNLSILAHEIGHHVNGHSLDAIVYASEVVKDRTLAESRQMELEADEYSGFVMYRLGASLSQAQAAIYLAATNDDDTYSTHPKLDKRLLAIERGYNKAKEQGSNIDYSTNSPPLTAEEYFYKAYENTSDFYYQIDNFTKCLRIDPDFYKAYFYRGLAYYNLEDYNNAIADYTRMIRIEPDYEEVYINRGVVYTNLKKYKEAIADFRKAIIINPNQEQTYINIGQVYIYLKNYQDAINNFTTAIEINPDRPSAYKGRAIAKRYYELPYCSDFKECCDSGDEYCCEIYHKECDERKKRKERERKLLQWIIK